MKFGLTTICTLLLASTAFSAPAADPQALANAEADPKWRLKPFVRFQGIWKRDAEAQAQAVADAAAAPKWRLKPFVRFQGIWKRDADAEADAEAEANPKWRLKPFVRFQGIWKRDENTTESTNTTEIGSDILGVVIAFDEDTGKPVDAAYIQSDGSPEETE